MFLQMLKDEFPDVRLHIISKLELVNKGNSHDPVDDNANQAPQLSALSYSHNPSSPLLCNWPRTSNGVFG